MIKQTAIAAAAFALSACAISPEQMNSFDYGAPPSNVEQSARAYFEPLLKDPASAQYRVGSPQKAAGRNGLVWGGGIGFVGYVAEVQVNAKNSFGGYTGWEAWTLFFSAGKPIDAKRGAPEYVPGLSLASK